MYGKQRNYMTTVLEKALNAALISSKDLVLPVKASCSLMHPLLPVCFSIPLHPHGLFDDLQSIWSHNPVICWSGWPQNLSMANHVCPWATVGLRKTHTKTYTRQKKNISKAYAHTKHSQMEELCLFHRWLPLSAACSEMRCVFSSAKCITYPLEYWLDTKPEAWFKSTNLSKWDLLSSVCKSNFSH